MSHPRKPWKKHDPLIGRTIIEVTQMSQQELAFWGTEAIVLQFDDGTRWWLGSDSEGNHGGDIHSMNQPPNGTPGDDDYDEGFTSQLVPIAKPIGEELTPGPLATLICERLDEESKRFKEHQLAGRSIEDYDGPDREKIIADTIHETLGTAITELREIRQALEN